MTQKAERKQGLGKGLSALLEEMGAAVPARASSEQPASPMTLPVALIDPSTSQPRRHFDEISLAELADSIRIKGVLQPILVRPVAGGRYEIVAGERRWRASQQAGLHDIPAVVREFSEGDSFEAALIENVQRADLNPIEEAQGYHRLVREYGHTQETVGALTGKSRSHIGNLLRILDLPDSVRLLVQDGKISLGHAKAALSAKDPEALAFEIVAREWSVRQAEKAARKSHEADAPEKAASPEPAQHNADVEALELQLRDATGLGVRIAAKGNSGTVTLQFADLDQLDLIVARLGASGF